MGHSSVSHSPSVFLLVWDALKEGFSGRNSKVSVLEERQHLATAPVGCVEEVLGGLLYSPRLPLCLLEFVWYHSFRYQTSCRVLVKESCFI